MKTTIHHAVKLEDLVSRLSPQAVRYQSTGRRAAALAMRKSRTFELMEFVRHCD
jgi:hypothetical protein